LDIPKNRISIAGAVMRNLQYWMFSFHSTALLKKQVLVFLPILTNGHAGVLGND